MPSMPSMPSLLLLPVLLAALPAVRAATCTRSETALTSACDDQCLEGRPCVAFAAGAACDESWSTFGTCTNESSTGCTFECFTNGPTDFAANGAVEFSDYTFLIPFGSTESKYEASWSSGEASWADAQLASGGNETDELPSLSNNDFEHIEALDLLDTTTSVTIAGGTSVFGVRGRVAKVVLATQLLVAETQLTSVTLANLQPEEAPPQNTFPPQLTHFGMPNCLLGAYPEDILLMDSLVSLDLSKNYLDDFPVKFSRPTLETLDLSVNTLASFDGDLPNLTSLDLANNTLSSIPDSIFAMTKLTTLNLSGNSFTGVALTSEQATFLNNLETLTIDNFGAVSCDASLQTTVGGATVCLASASGSGSSATATTSSGGSNTGAIVGGIIGGIVALGIVIAIAMFVYRRRHRNDEDKSRTKKTTTTGTMAHSTIGSEMRDAGSLWTDQELLSLQVNLDDIEDIRKIGVGAFGVVYLAKYRGTKLVASKRLKRDEVNWQNTQQFIAEIKLVARLDHPRVVKLVGIAWSIEADLQALFEYMENGDLRTHLENPQTPRSWDDGEKLQIAIDVVDALVYVHSFSPPLVHRDLKSRNVLLDGEYRGNLSDFGVARFRSEANTMTAGVGTGRWLAPEVIQGNCDYDQACDVFAFGVVLSEMDTHTLPYEDVRGPGGNQLADVAILQLVAAGRLLPSFTPQCPHELHELALRCMALHREERPSAVELAYALRTLQKSLRFSTGALV